MYLAGALLLASSGFNADQAARTALQSAQSDPVVAWAVLNTNSLGYEAAVNTLSSYTNLIPVFGYAKMLSEGLGGKDLFSGRQLSSFERASDVLGGGLGLFASGWGSAFGEAGGIGAGSGLCGVSGNSFVAGTLVDSDKGLVGIETLKVGDKVWAQDPNTGESGYRAITHTTNHTTDEVVQLTIGQTTTDAQSTSANLPDGIALASTLGSLVGSSSGASPGWQLTNNQTKTDNSTTNEAGSSTLPSETIEATPQHPIMEPGI